MPLTTIPSVLLILAASVLLGEIFQRVGLVKVAAELLAGIILGPSFLGLILVTQQIAGIMSVCLFFIMFSIGFELTTEALRPHIFRGSFLSFASFVVPIIPSFFIANLFNSSSLTENFSVVLSLSVPSISIISVMLLNLGLVRTSIGQLVLSSVTITDVVAFTLLALIGKNVYNALITLTYVIIVILAFSTFDSFVNKNQELFRKTFTGLTSGGVSENLYFATVLIIGLGIASVFQFFGISYILGAFFAGLVFHEGLIGKESFGRISRSLSRLNDAFFIPVYFGFAGAEAVIKRTVSSVLVTLSLSFVVLATSFTATWLLSYFLLKQRRAALVSLILNGRGAVGIIIATLALGSGMISADSYSVAIVGITIISLVVSFLLKSSAKEQKT